MVVTRDRDMRRIVRVKAMVMRVGCESRCLIYSRRTMISNTALHTGKLLRT